MKNLGNIQLLSGLPKINMAIYGLSGRGKTTLTAGVCTDPRTSPALWVDAMGNPLLQLQAGNIQYGVSIDSFLELNDVIDWLLTGQKPTHKFAVECKKTGVPLPDEPFKALVIDTFSYAQQLLIDHVLKVKPLTGKLAQTGLKKIDATTHGGEVAYETLALIRKILLLPIHTFCVYQLWDKTQFDAGEGGTITGAKEITEIQLYGQSRKVIPPWHNLMGEIDLIKTLVQGKAQTVQRIYWRDPEKLGKNQVAQSLGEYLDNPTMGQILDLIEGDWRKQSEQANQQAGA